MSYIFPSWSRLRQLGLCALAASLIGLSLTGCMNLLEPRSSDATYYLLHTPHASDASPSDTTGLIVGLRQPRMASHLTATRIVTRRGPHQVRFSEFHRWGEDLNRGISRTVAHALVEQDGIQSVEVVPWPKGTAFDYIVQLHVLSFEGVGPPPDPDADEDAPSPTGHSQMIVEWKILDPEREAVLKRGRTRFRTDGWTVGDYEALASSLGDGLAVLADDIGAQLTTLDRP